MVLEVFFSDNFLHRHFKNSELWYSGPCTGHYTGAAGPWGPVWVQGPACVMSHSPSLIPTSLSTLLSYKYRQIIPNIMEEKNVQVWFMSFYEWTTDLRQNTGSPYFLMDELSWLLLFIITGWETFRKKFIMTIAFTKKILKIF